MFWRSGFDPSIVRVSVHADATEPADAKVDFGRINGKVSVLRLSDRSEYVRVTSGFNSVVLQVVEGSILPISVVLRCHLDDMRNVPAQVQAVDRFYTLWRQHAFRKGDFRLDKRRHRWLLALNALDMDVAGYSHRQIADKLFSESMEISWKEPGGRTRSRVRRIIALGKELSEIGYQNILTGRSGLGPHDADFSKPLRS